MAGLLITFLAAFSALLVFDIYAHRNSDEVSLRSALTWSAFYVGCSLAFAGLVWFASGWHDASLFLTGYILEKALSVDNLVVFGAVFAYFSIPPKFQHRILYYGIIGAALFRLIFVILVGGPLYLFGRPVELVLAALVAWTAYKMFKGSTDEAEEIVDHSNRWYIKAVGRVFHVTGDASLNRFFKCGVATPLFLCLVSIEVTDVMFAFDSIPTVVSVTQEPILIYSAMMFAIMGLRSMYFVLSALQRYLSYVNMSVSVVLGFIAAKLAAHAIIGFEIDPFASLFIVLSVIATGVVVSLASPIAVKEPK